MQFVSRNSIPVPRSFTNEMAKADRSALADFFKNSDEVLAQSSPPSNEFELDGQEVLLALNELFHGKCAFCESRGSLNIHFFRPAEEAQPLARSEFAHLYYVWLRSDWANTYPICFACSSVSKRLFPVRRGERGRLPSAEEMKRFVNVASGIWPLEHQDRNLLLDPCETKSFVTHLEFERTGHVHGLSTAGEATIAAFNLGREDLVEGRRAAFDTYVNLLHRDLERGPDSSAFDFKFLEFGGAWFLLLRRALMFAAAKSRKKIKFGKTDLHLAFFALWKTPVGREDLEEGLTRVDARVRSKFIRRPWLDSTIPQLTSIQIQNFKSIELLELSIGEPVVADAALGREAQAAAVLILGENAVGKSSILEALALASMDAKIRDAVKIAPSSFVLDPRLMGAPNSERPHNSTITLQFADDQVTKLVITDHFTEELIAKLMPPVFAYGAFRQYASGSPARAPQGHTHSLFHSDSLLANPQAWLLKLPDDEFSMVVRALKHTFIVDGDFDVIKKDTTNNRCLVVSRVWDGKSHREIITPLLAVSSGFRSVLGMVCDILAGLLNMQKPGARRSFADVSALILIDEIEAHLHPRWKMQIISALRRVFPSSTIIASTHDPLCLRGMHEGEVAVLKQNVSTLDNAGTIPIRIEKVMQLPNVENLTIEQLLTSDFFAMFSTDSVEAEERLAKLGDLLALRDAGKSLSKEDALLLTNLRGEIVTSLPFGSTEVQRLVQDAINEYLKNRRQVSTERLGMLRSQTRQAIITALEEF